MDGELPRVAALPKLLAVVLCCCCIAVAVKGDFVDKAMHASHGSLSVCQTQRLNHLKEKLAEARLDDLVAPWPSTGAGSLNLITQIFGYPAGRHPSVHPLLSCYREDELANTLQVNILHPHVAKVYLLYEEDEFAKLLDTWCIADVFQKVVLKRIPFGGYTYQAAFTFANTISGPTIMLHSDIFLGSGFTDVRSLLKPKQVVALSRHAFCPGDENQCAGYKGSHDAFLFNPPIQDSLINRVGFRPNNWGAENHMIWNFMKEGYEVVNYCSDMMIWHNHCVGIRPNTSQGHMEPDRREYAFPMKRPSSRLRLRLR